MMIVVQTYLKVKINLPLVKLHITGKPSPHNEQA